MKILVFMGSPRQNGCTATLLKSFIEKLKKSRAEVKIISLYDKKIAPCQECYYCTAPMKAMFDCFNGLHKYYGEQYGSRLLERKNAA